MTTEEKELWAKVINDARWYDGTPQMLNQLTEHFEKQGIVVKNCSIPDVVGQSEQLKAFVEWQIKGNCPYAGMFIDEHIKEYFKIL